MSFNDKALIIEDLSKCYQIYDQPADRLKQMLFPPLRHYFLKQKPKQYFTEYWALRNVSFELRKGETVGIIGRNGAGKSTLLQLICGTLTPTSGQVEINGRVAALLELGSGFNPEFTGIENVYLYGAVLGFNRHEMEEKLEDISQFAGIGDFIHQQIKTYSSGMVVRLAFAVNIVSQPDIMIVDEALAVGDMNFQAKCMTALTRIQEKGATILFVSHDVNAVKSLCSRGVYLENGVVKAIGKASDIAELYIRNMREEMNGENREITSTTVDSDDSNTGLEDKQSRGMNSVDLKRSEEFEKRVTAFRYGAGGARITFADLLDENFQPIRHIEFDQEVRVVINFETTIEEEISCNYYIADDKRNLILGSGMKLAGKELLKTRRNGKYTFVYKTRMPLQDGNYSIQLQLTKPVILNQTAEFLDVIDDAIVFQVLPRQGARTWTRVHVPNILEVVEG